MAGPQWGSVSQMWRPTLWLRSVSALLSHCAWLCGGCGAGRCRERRRSLVVTGEEPQRGPRPQVAVDQPGERSGFAFRQHAMRVVEPRLQDRIVGLQARSRFVALEAILGDLRPAERLVLPSPI
jgi:hypothetical protein